MPFEMSNNYLYAMIYNIHVIKKSMFRCIVQCIKNLLKKSPFVMSFEMSHNYLYTMVHDINVLFKFQKTSFDIHVYMYDDMYDNVNILFKYIIQ